MKKTLFIFSLVLAFFGTTNVVFAGLNTSSVCISGTINNQSRTCQVYVNNVPTLVSFCMGDETSGPCRPVRIDQNAANQLAVQAKINLDKNGYTNSSCLATAISFPGVDVNTGLKYYMDTSCTVSGIPGLSAEALVTDQGIQILGCDLVKAGVSGAKCGTSGGGPGGSPGATTTNNGLNNPNLEGIASDLKSKYFSGGFDPTSGHDQAMALQLKTKTYAQSVASQAFQAFDNFISGNSVGTNSLGVLSTSEKAIILPAPGCTISSDLKLGDSGDRVTTLTGILVSDGELQSAQDVFDNVVLEAVKTFQAKYASDILTPLGITTPTGIVGSATRAFISSHWSSCPAATPVTSGVVSARYIKINMTRAGWVAVREIEAYDQSGTKINMSGASATASCTWCNYGTVPAGVDPKSAIDGNMETMWNAGETASNCNWGTPDASGNLGCPSTTLRSAWIIVDLGSVKSLSKIRFASTGNTNEKDVLSVSQDNKSWTDLATFTGNSSNPIADRQWLTWPAETKSNPGTPPVVDFVANGGSSVSVHSGGDSVILNWSVKNADNVIFAVSGQNKQCIPYGDPDPYKWNSFPYAPDNALGIHGLGTQFEGGYFWKDFFTCEKGNNIKITLTASQVGGTSASKSITIQVDGSNTTLVKAVENPYSSGQNWGYSINANYQEFYLKPGMSASTDSFSGQPTIVQINSDAGTYGLLTGSPTTAAYPLPTVSADKISGLNVSLGTPNIISEVISSTTVKTKSIQKYSLSVDGGFGTGVYKIRIYANKGMTDEGFIDIPVFISNNLSANASGVKSGVVKSN